MSVFLETNRPVRQQYVYPRRANVTGAIVVHTAECVADWDGPDTSAESVARYIQSRTNAGSYHSVFDSDSIVRVGRYEWEMYGEGTGGNRWALHLSMACRTTDLKNPPREWLERAILNGAQEARNMAAWVKDRYGIVVPAKRITEVEYRAGRPGFIPHGDLDPDRRSDPGPFFPWEMFLTYFATEEEDPMAIADLEARLARQEELLAIAFDVLPYADGSYQIVEGLYKVILKREPDPQGLVYWADMIESGTPLTVVLKEFLDRRGK